MSDADEAKRPVETADYMNGKAGTITIHNIRTVHGSMPNVSSRMRPLLINAYASADAFSLTPYPGSTCSQNETVIRGKRSRVARFDQEECRMPLDWSGGYSSIFALQQDEEGAGRDA